MLFRTKLIGFASLLALGALVSAGSALWLAREIERSAQSVSIAEEQLAIYLDLETLTSDLLRYYVTAPVLPQHGIAERLAATERAVRENVAAIRRLVAREIRFRGQEELEELDRLDRIVAVLDVLRQRYARTPPRTNPTPADLLEGIVDIIDRRLSPLIDAAVTDEVQEVSEARATMEGRTRWAVLAGTLAGLLTLLAAASGVWFLLRSVARPFGALEEGATRLARGELSHRIPILSRGELGQLSTDFNMMADRLEAAVGNLREEERRLQERVTERTDDLERANERLAMQDAMRRRFLADVSHELRTPLTVMRGEAEVALRAGATVESHDARGALQSVVEQAEHMGRLVDDLLFVARREAGEARLALRPVPLAPILDKAVAAAGVIADRAAVGIELDNDAQSTVLEADAGRLYQLLMVLLDNALRYSPGGSTVLVRAMHAPNGVTITIADRGIGIPDQELPHVFDRFVRGSNALPGGTGLGLPVAKAIAEAHGGSLRIESREGRGSTAALTLPAATTELRSVA